MNYGSDEYFKLIAENPELGRYLAIGKNVKFCSGGQCFNVYEMGGIPTTTIYVTQTTTPGITPIANNQTVIQTIAIVGLIILISVGILLFGRRK